MTSTTPTTARIRQVVLDTTDVRGLAEFYRRLTGWEYRAGDEPPAELDWVVLRNPDGGISIAFQLADALPASTWPDPAVPQQLHLDLCVPDVDSLRSEHERVQGLGARMISDEFDDPDEPMYVYTDPAGHPFCIFVSSG